MSVRLIALFAPLFLMSCDDHLIGECEADQQAYSADWAGVEDMFVAQCVVCHTAEGSGGFDLSVAIETDLSDDDDSNNLYVIPGDPEGSLLWQSLSWEGTARPMPEGAQQPLSECVAGHVFEWITDGAVIPDQALTTGSLSTTTGTTSR